MLDKLSEPPIPHFARPGPMYHGEPNLSTQVRKMNMANNANQNLHSSNAFVTQKTFLSHSQVSQESTDDEFSDFQSAPAFSQVNQAKFPPGPGAPGFGFGSPLHLSSTIQPVEVGIRSPAGSIMKPGVRGGNKESIVGCRLANYDLGFPTASPRIGPQQQQQRTPPMIQPQVSVTSFNTSLTQPTQSFGENLLIGEEDKYSALRGLTDFVASEPSIFDVAENQNSTGCSIQHKISLVSDDVLEVVKTETTDSSIDFGEFKKFSSDQEYSAISPSNGFANNNIYQTSGQKPSDFDFMNLGSNFDIKIEARNRETAFHSNDLHGLNVLAPAPKVQQVSSCNDGEFGDFVCFNSVSVGATEPPPAHASPKLVVKSEIHKKSSTVSSTSKSKKPSHNVGRPNVARIAKASNILTESPTFPKPDQSQIKINDRSLFYEASSVLKDPTSFEIDVQDFDFGLCKTPPENSTCDPAKKIETLEFGAPLKTTLIGNSSDVDDFGDFAGVQQVESSSKMNSLDLLPYSNKFHCPAETQSLASLDLGNYLESSDGKSSGENETSPGPPDSIGFDSYVKDELSDTATDSICSTMLAEKCFVLSGSEVEVQPSASEADKYKCFKDELENERDRCTSEWSRCLESCLNLLSYGHNILNSLSSSDVVREVVSNEKGCSYILNLMEVYLVSCRINHSWKKLGGGMKIQQLIEDITATWESLTPFFMGAPVMESISKVDDWKLDDYSYGENFKICGVCLVSSNDEDNETLLDYGGKYYHSTCANLWVNEVDSILPSLYCFSNSRFLN